MLEGILSILAVRAQTETLGNTQGCPPAVNYHAKWSLNETMTEPIPVQFSLWGSVTHIFLLVCTFFLSLLSHACFGGQQEEVSCQLGEVKVQIPQNDVTLHPARPYCFRAGVSGRSCVSWCWSRFYLGALKVSHLRKKEKLFLLSCCALKRGRAMI